MIIKMRNTYTKTNKRMSLKLLKYVLISFENNQYLQKQMFSPSEHF